MATRTATPSVTRTLVALTPTPIPLDFCVGDNSGLATITVADLIVGVNIALGLSPLEACPAFDFNGNGVVTVDELLRAVNTALNDRP
jgi:hypothetical protein